jgi:hypothetical protein
MTVIFGLSFNLVSLELFAYFVKKSHVDWKDYFLYKEVAFQKQNLLQPPVTSYVPDEARCGLETPSSIFTT